MIVLDTNVISEISKPLPNARVMSWLNRQQGQRLFLTAITVAEMQEGIELLPAGKRKEALRKSVDETIAGFMNPVLSFDTKAAYKFAALVVRAKANLYTLPVSDGYIAAIAAVHDFAVATRDVDPYVAAGVPVINPWEE
jgi:predicted nucleic acid-binding protein